MTRLVQATHQNPLRVVIVGGGVAAVEGLLALRAMAGSLVDVTLVAPEARFVFRPIAVAEPFGLSEPREHDLRALAKDQRAQLVEDSFTGLDSERRVARTARSGELEYDALMLALGARRSEALPGALTFRDSADVGAFRELLRELETGAVVSLALAVPPAVRWPLAAYELVLLTAAHLRARGVRGARLAIATHEP